MKRVALAVVVVAACVALAGGQSSGEHWVATWTTATIGRPAYPPPSGEPSAAPTPARVPFPNDQTLREIVHTTIGGDRVRVVVSNAFGTLPLAIGAAHVALRDKESAIVGGTDRVATFSGRTTATVPAGAMLVSDPVALNVGEFTDLAIDLFLPGDTAGQTLTVHRGAFQTNYLSAAGNHAGESSFAGATTVPSWLFLERVEVSTSTAASAIVTLGDSITDGTGSTLDANARWPDVFARRLAGAKGVRAAVLNAGIAGNRVLSESIPEFGVNLLARLDRDVLTQPGVTHMIVMEGINDIGNARDNPAPTADDLIAAHKQVIDRAHTYGIRVIGATLTPFEGSTTYYTEVGERKRAAVNEWIRNGRAYDGVIDFDAATRDPLDPKRFLPQYDRGDHLHPNDAGYQAMANAVNLSLFGVSR